MNKPINVNFEFEHQAINAWIQTNKDVRSGKFQWEWCVRGAYLRKNLPAPLDLSVIPEDIEEDAQKDYKRQFGENYVRKE